MSRRKKLILCLSALVIGTVGYIVYRVWYTVHYGIPEAYAAWNTGELLVAYLRNNDDQWPTSWDDLEVWVWSNPPGDSHWDRGEDSVRHVRHLQELIAVDWSFDPGRPHTQTPITPIGGGEFETLFVGTEPNEHVREYLQKRASMQPASIDLAVENRD